MNSNTRSTSAKAGTAVVLTLAAIPALFGCVITDVQRLPAYDLAVKMPGSDHPKLFFSESIDSASMPALTPYAIITVRGPGLKSRDRGARTLWSEGATLKADVIEVTDVVDRHRAFLQTHMGLPVSVRQAMDDDDSQVMYGVCYRLNPARVGFQTNDHGMVLSILPESNLKDAGLLEGDTLLSIDGVPYRAGSHSHLSRHHKRFLAFKPGENVKLTWIRPGRGRLEGLARCVDNPPTHLDIPDSIPCRHSPPEGALEGARGTLKLSRAGERIVITVHLYGLAPESVYDISFVSPDGVTSESIGMATTNPEGNANLKVDTDKGDPVPFGVGELSELLGFSLVVSDAEGNAVLVSEVRWQAERPPELGESSPLFVLQSEAPPELPLERSILGLQEVDLAGEFRVELARDSCEDGSPGQHGAS